MRPASHCTLSLHARVSRYWLLICSSTLDHMIFYTIYNLQCMKTETLKCKTWLTLSLLDSSSWLLSNHVVTGQSVSLIHVQAVKFLHCRADISFRLGSRIIRDHGASLRVHLRTQVRGHHSLLLTSICLLIFDGVHSRLPCPKECVAEHLSVFSQGSTQPLWFDALVEPVCPLQAVRWSVALWTG